MKRRAIQKNFAGGLVAAVGLLAGGGAPLDAAQERVFDRAVLTEIDGSVWLMMPKQALQPASAKQQVGGDSAVKTGARSRAEMEFPEGSLVRLGSNAIFSFRCGTREMSLDVGALLLHVPKGYGTTTVRTASATASITGTTVIVSATEQGGFRLVVLEGVAEARYRDGARVRCQAGDMTVRQPGQAPPRAPSQVHLGSLVNSSRLTSGFHRILPSLTPIQSAIRIQTIRLNDGALTPTGRTLDASNLDVSGTLTDRLSTSRDTLKLPDTMMTATRPTDMLSSQTIRDSSLVRTPSVVRDKTQDPRILQGNIRSIDTINTLKR